MIRLTRLNHSPFFLNSDLIEHIEITPDTVVSLTNGQKFLVLETADEVLEKVVAYQRAIHAPPGAAQTGGCVQDAVAMTTEQR